MTPQASEACFARRFEFDLARWSEILDRVCEHRPWFNDKLWADEARKRASAAAYLTDAHLNGMLWEVWRGNTLVGIAFLDRLDFGMDARAHFVFFDRALADKRLLCLNLLAWCFEHLELEVMRTEVPTYARALADWARVKLGFRYEGERTLSWPRNIPAPVAAIARLGARKSRAILYEGQLHDILLLSVTKQEFTEHHVRTIDEARKCEFSAHAGPLGAAGSAVSELPAERPASPAV